VILEIGFGTGRCAVALAQSVGDSGKVYGIDISPGMCSAARSLVHKMGLSERVELTCGDAAFLPYEDGSFDAVFMSFSLELFDTPEIAEVLGECKRVLRRGGRVCVVAMSKTGNDNAMTRLYEWLHVRFPRYVDCRPIWAEESVSAAGFRVMQVRRLSSWGLQMEVVLACMD
jgi:ubiquinone/menaquinone biosynthesis C-methylase UbiE